MTSEMIEEIQGKYSLKVTISFLVVCAILFFLDSQYSRDIYEYTRWFKESQSLPFAGRVALIDWTKDPAYFFLQAIGAQISSFPVFLFALIFLCLSLKLLALMQLFPKPNWLIALPYLLCLAFLHEGTQIRVALALSIVIWAVVLWVTDRSTPAILVLLFASLFHASVAIYFVIFLVLFFARYLGFYAYSILIFTFIVLAHFLSGDSLLAMYQGKFAQARYFYYLNPEYLKLQNSSGLFYFYPIFISIISGAILWFYAPQSLAQKKLKEVALVSSIVAIGFLITFAFSVQIATRFADLLLLSPLLVLGLTLAQLREGKRFFCLSLVLIALTVYCFLRSYISFGPALRQGLL